MIEAQLFRIHACVTSGIHVAGLKAPCLLYLSCRRPNVLRSNFYIHYSETTQEIAESITENVLPQHHSWIRSPGVRKFQDHTSVPEQSLREPLQDETRLPSGMERIGHDDQTPTYTFIDRTQTAATGKAKKVLNTVNSIAKATREILVCNDIAIRKTRKATELF